MDFNDYVNQLNNLDKQETKSELENFYFFNSGVLQFFKGIDSQVQAVLNASVINPKSVELIQTQLNTVLPMLNQLKFKISMFDTNSLSEAHKDKINQLIAYIKSTMSIGEVDIISNQLADLLKQNETAFAQEKEQRAKDEAERIAKAEREKKEREEAQRKAKEEHERREREEKERIAKAEAERKAKEERERKEREEAERRAKEEKERMYEEQMANDLVFLMGQKINSNPVKIFLRKFQIQQGSPDGDGIIYEIDYNYSSIGRNIYLKVKDEKIYSLGVNFYKTTTTQLKELHLMAVSLFDLSDSCDYNKLYQSTGRKADYTTYIEQRTGIAYCWYDLTFEDSRPIEESISRKIDLIIRLPTEERKIESITLIDKLQ